MVMNSQRHEHFDKEIKPEKASGTRTTNKIY